MEPTSMYYKAGIIVVHEMCRQVRLLWLILYGLFALLLSSFKVLCVCGVRSFIRYAFTDVFLLNGNLSIFV